MEIDKQKLAILQADKEDDSSLFSVSGLLAGFSFSAILLTLSIPSPGNIHGWVFAAFLIATFMFLGSTVLLLMILESITATQRHLQFGRDIDELKYTGKPRVICYIFFYLGLVSVLIGVAMLSFTYNVILGGISIFLVVTVISGIVLASRNLDYENDFETEKSDFKK